jgi:site-specific DNA recombinase
MAPQAFRCAIYTRKSSEEGLEQTFNSLDAQREACEAYVKSQSHEGWAALTGRYDDGGYSGGTMDRPGLQRLLTDVAQGLLDIVVVYKVDRLTRSLADFAKIVEILDRHDVSFVSITQQFNTTSSMGRLTLNVLLSFAQFEREVTGERIRDKISASKQKGMWMGGNLPLGYDVSRRKLVVIPREAAQVRAIYRRYLELGTVAALARDLRQRGIHSKSRTTQAGKTMGGNGFSRGALYCLLKNRLYLGEVVHKDKSYAGEHPPIIAKAIWDQVQARLSEHRHKQGERSPNASLLAGLLFDDRGNPMSPSHTKKPNGTRYRYYVSQAFLQQRHEAAGTLARIAAPVIETLVENEVMARLTQSSRDSIANLAPAERATQIRLSLRRVEASADRIVLSLARSGLTHADLSRGREAGERPLAASGDTISVTIPIRLRAWRGKTIIEAPTRRTMRPARPDPALIKAVVRAQQWRTALASGAAPSLEALARQAGCGSQYVRQVLNLSLLAPDIVEAILHGRQPLRMRVTDLLTAPMPSWWPEQRHVFGFDHLA